MSTKEGSLSDSEGSLSDDWDFEKFTCPESPRMTQSSSAQSDAESRQTFCIRGPCPDKLAWEESDSEDDDNEDGDESLATSQVRWSDPFDSDSRHSFRICGPGQRWDKLAWEDGDSEGDADDEDDDASQDSTSEKHREKVRADSDYRHSFHIRGPGQCWDKLAWEDSDSEDDEHDDASQDVRADSDHRHSFHIRGLGQRWDKLAWEDSDSEDDEHDDASQEALARFEDGAVNVHATSYGHHQWSFIEIGDAEVDTNYEDIDQLLRRDDA